ncbi:Mrp/NBP35 family ATP-binding protein [Methylocapsa sp. S129]|uniref:Mrp/NBP35 family ATP-binding protein n=1 Tax=Methylocapsa sp. S129 TaxID=1641869 RepID=UPI00131DB890|nr:Mrp/NBP35 family ATP-binding protein [Methylocapsa sp. S129]
MLDENAITQALGAVHGPDGRTPLTQSGAIGGLTHRDGKVYLSIVVDPAQADRAEPMRKAAENALRAVAGVTAAIVTLTSERAPGAPAPHSHSHAPAKAATRRVPESVAGVRHIIAVASGKGGVGKSTTAANLAIAMAKEGWRIGLLDADVFGPSAPRLFGLTEKPKVEQSFLVPLVAHGIKVISIGLMIDEEAPVVWRGPMVMSAVTQLLREVAWGELDCLVVDMPPGTGDVQLTMAQSAPLAGAIIVSTPQDLALIDARRGIAMFEKVSIPVLGIIENMSYFICPHCQGRSDIFAHGGARHEAEKRGVAFLGEVPLDIEIRETSDSGRPIVAASPDSPHALVYRTIARAVIGKLDAPQRAAPKIVIG